MELSVSDATHTAALPSRLLSYLRAALASPALQFASPPARLQGGYETSTYRFRLEGAPEELCVPLVLRLYPAFYGPRNAIWESAVQNVLAGQGYPVARAHLLCTNMSVLGGAFFVMDYLPGDSLVAAPPETVPGLLGRTHAELHDIDPAPLVEAFHREGITEHEYRLTGRFSWLRDRGEELPWVRPAVEWLLANRPPEPERLSVCHGDFHPLNLLYDNGRVTAVLDWPGFAVADAAFDVGNTLVLLTIACKHLAASLVGLPRVDWDLFARLYLAAYRAHRRLGDTYLAYYRVRRCVSALLEGFDGQQVWQHPLIVRDLLAYVLDTTGIELTLPD
jgi:aminoglycoside phosphotransferase (APT) family kinase protein